MNRPRVPWICLALMLSALAAEAVAQQVIHITTQGPWGGDAYVSSASRGNHGSEPLLRIAADPTVGLAEKAYLRFDLACVRGHRITHAVLTLHPAGGDPHPQQLNILGLRELRTDGGFLPAEFWRETTPASSTPPTAAPPAPGSPPPPPIRPGPIAWSSAPANNPLSLGGFRTDPRQPPPGLRGGADVLGTITLASDRPETARLTGDPLVRFLNADLNGVATLVLTRATRNGSPTLIASREHPFLAAPTLSLTLEELTPAETAARIASFPLTVDTKRQRIETQWLAVETRAVSAGWGDALPLAEALHAAVIVAAQASVGPWAQQGVDPLKTFPDATTSVAAGVTRLLLAEAQLAAGRITPRQWREVYLAVLNRSPARADELLYTVRTLSPSRWRDRAELGDRRESLLLGLPIPPRARDAAAAMLDADTAPPSHTHPLTRARHYRSRLLPARAPVSPLDHQEILRHRLTVVGRSAAAESHAFDARLTAETRGWKAAMPAVDALARAAWDRPSDAASDTPVSSGELVAAWASLLRAEAARAAALMSDDDSLATYEVILNQHPEHAAVILQALDVTLGEATSLRFPPGSTRLKAALYGDWPEAARQWLARRTGPLTLIEDILQTPIALRGRTMPLQLHFFSTALQSPASSVNDLCDKLLAAARVQLDSAASTYDKRRLTHAITTLELLRSEDRIDASWLATLPPAAADCLRAAFILSGKRLVKDRLVASDLSPLQQRLLPTPLTGVVEEFASIREPRRFLATMPTADPLILVRYIEALDALGDEAAAVTFLDQLLAALPDASIAPTAALLRIARTTPDLARDDMVIALHDARPHTPAARVIRAHYLAAMARRNNLETALLYIDEHARIASARRTDEAAAAIVSLIVDACTPPDLSTYLPRGRGDLLAILERPIANALLANIGAEYRRQGDHETAAAVLAAGIAAAIPADAPWIAELRPLVATDAPRAASMLLALALSHIGDQEGARKLIDAALVEAPPKQAAHLLLARSRVSLASGQAAAAFIDTTDALALLGPGSVAVSAHRTLAFAAQPPALGLAYWRRLFDESSRTMTAEPNPDRRYVARLSAAFSAATLGYDHQCAHLYRSFTQVPDAHDVYGHQGVALALLRLEASPDPASAPEAKAHRARLARYLATPIRPRAPLAYYESLHAARIAASGAEGAGHAISALGLACDQQLAREAQAALELLLKHQDQTPLAQLALADRLLTLEAGAYEEQRAQAAPLRELIARKYLKSSIPAIPRPASPVSPHVAQ